jgi:hypothetical protein
VTKCVTSVTRRDISRKIVLCPRMYPPCILIVVMFLLIMQRVFMLNLFVPQFLVTKRKPFGYQRPWLLTSKDPNKFGYLKEIDFLFLGELQGGRESLGVG